jgi:hypothetical protein
MTKGCIELSLPVDPVQPIEASLIQVNESSRTRDIGHGFRVHGPNSVKLTLVHLEGGKMLYQLLRAISHGLIAVDKIVIRIAQDSVLRAQSKKECTASQEWLDVFAERRWHTFEKKRQQVGFAPGPFEKRPRFKRVPTHTKHLNLAGRVYAEALR